MLSKKSKLSILSKSLLTIFAIGGGAIYNSTVCIAANEFISNSSDYGGGAVANIPSALNFKTSMTFKGTTLFQNNQALGGSGGAIWNADAQLEFLGTQEFIGNSAKYGWGGAIASIKF
mgnify:FL=1